MAKDPAVLFYTGDFLNGCSCLTMEERGQYITLLCLQHQSGHLSEKTIRLSVGSVSVDVLKKFAKDSEGNFFNERMESEIKKRLQFVESRRDNGSKGGRPKKPSAEPSGKPLGYPSENLIENENTTDIIISNEDIVGKYWQKWKNYLKQEFNITYNGDISETEARKELITLSGNNAETAMKIIDQCIAKKWKGLYKLNDNGNRGNKTAGATTEDLLDAIIEGTGIDS